MGRRTVRGSLTWHVLDLEEWPKPRPAPSVVIWTPSRVANVLVGGVYEECTELLLPGYVLIASRLPSPRVEELIRARLVRGPVGLLVVSVKDLAKLRQDEETEVWNCVELPFSPGQSVLFKKSVGHGFGGMHGRFRGLVMTMGGFYAKVDVDVPGSDALLGQYVPYDGIVPVGVPDGG